MDCIQGCRPQEPLPEMEVEKSSVTLAFVDAPYFRKLFSPPLVEGSVGTEWQQARLCICTVQLEANRGGSR